MEKNSIPLSLLHEGQHYTGWATPSDKRHADGQPSSYRVVLNETFFGDMSYDKGHWIINEQRPHDLVAAVGETMNYLVAG